MKTSLSEPQEVLQTRACGFDVGGFLSFQYRASC